METAFGIFLVAGGVAYGIDALRAVHGWKPPQYLLVTACLYTCINLLAQGAEYLK